MKKLFTVCVSLMLFFIAGSFINLSAQVSPQGIAPDFTLSDTEGVTFTLSDLKGKTVLLSFGASWCPFCVEEVPVLIKIQENNKDKNFQLLAINLDSSINKAKKFKEKQRLNYPLLFDADNKVTNAYSVRGIPANFVVDEYGQVYSFGPDIESAQKQLNELIKQNKKINKSNKK
ncbi:MAG: TlpA family protein disulfide reductase [Endomicrobiales bacterium]|nr:TlpA family protein disulfide reductase [Endomicrobiales bacterium]